MEVLPPGEERVYHISPRRRWVVLGVWLLMAAIAALPLLLIAGEKHDWPLLTVVAVVALGTVLIPLELVRVSRLVLSAEGIDLRGFRDRKSGLFTRWENVAAIRLEKPGAEGLILKEPLQGRDAERLARFRGAMINGAPMNDSEKRDLLGEHRFLPIEPFAYWIRHGDLWEQIRNHAPWLADAAGQPVGYSPRVTEQGWTRKNVLVVIVVTVALGVGLVAVMLPPKSQAILFGVMNAIMGVCVGIFAINNLVAGFLHLRRRHLLEGGLWFTMGLIQAGLAWAILSSIVGPSR
jgi:hypothetical protein